MTSPVHDEKTPVIDLESLRVESLTACAVGNDMKVERAPPANMVTSASVIVLAFILILTLWDTWSTFTDILAPIPDGVIIRCLLNAILIVIGSFVVYKYSGQDSMRRFVILGNLLVGIGLWEFTEGIIETVLGDALLKKLVFYGTCFITTFALVMYLEKTDRLHVIDSPFMSPI